MTLQMKRVISLVICVMFGATLMLSCTKGRRAKYSKADRQRFIQTHNLGRLPKSDVPLEMNERVIAWMDYFSGSGARHFRKYLQRSGKYVPMMRQILKKNGVPQDLVYIALIESGFNNHARSHASAVGPWQFIRSTGKHYGLRIDSWVDERRDPVKATHAAAKFFRKLYGDYAHWYLAMAGYNAGEGRVNSAIRKSGSKNFWVHANPNKKYLKPETRDYVPKYIAATIMAKMPEKFGFGNVEYDKPLNYEIVVIDSQTDLVVAGKCAGVSRSTLELLNPELRLGSTPPGVRNYGLKVPKGRKERFKVAYAKVPRKERIKLVTHKVKNRETMTKVARKYGVSTKALARANSIGRKSRLHAGTELVIPIGAAYRQRVAKAESYGGGRGRRTTYRVRRGDTLGGIANKHRVKVSQLKKWNKIRGTRIRAGQKLTVRSPASKVASKRGTSRTTGGTYVVKSGDTPGTIAQKHGVKTSQLVAWNKLNRKRPVVRVGQKLTIKGGKVAKKSQGAPMALNKKTKKKTVARRPGGSVHTLKSGQTLGHVAELYGVRTKDIMRWNNIKNPRRIRAGAKLTILGGTPSKQSTKKKPPSKEKVVAKKKASAPQAPGMAPAKKVADVASAPTTTKPAPVKKKASSRKYKIKSGDSLWSVAQKHNVSVSDIKKWNSIGKSNKIKPGQSIVIKK